GVAIMDWSFVATDIDDVSISYARANVELNNLQHKIEIRDAKKAPTGEEEDKGGDKKDNEDDAEGESAEAGEKEKEEEEEEHGERKPRKPRDNVLLGVIKDGETFSFCMCNPPFFSDMEQAAQNPKTVCMGTEGEMVTEGGEIAFVKR